MNTTQRAFLNLNAVQTYLSAALVAIPALFISVGCSQSSIGTLECAHSSLPILTPTVTLIVTGLLTFLKFVLIPATQPGGWFRNLFEPKVPVSQSGEPGTVTQKQVDAGAKK